MDAEVTRFAGQAIGLAHHTLGDAYYRGLAPAGGWPAALALMKRTFEQGEGKEFATNGKTGVAPGATLPLYSHTLDLAGAALAVSNICAGLGDGAGAATYLKLSANFKNVIDATNRGLMDQKSDYYEGALESDRAESSRPGLQPSWATTTSMLPPRVCALPPPP
jgi:hypothetical protein